MPGLGADREADADCVGSRTHPARACGRKWGLELARKRAGLAEPAPLPTDDEFARGVLDLRRSHFDDRG